MTKKELEYSYLSEIAYVEALLNDCDEEHVITKHAFACRIERLKNELDLIIS